MQLTKSKKIWITILILMIIFISIGTFFVVKPYSVQKKVKPKRGDIVESIYGLGVINSDKIFRVRAGIALAVKNLYVREGDEVKPGSPLVKLDESIMRSPIEGTVTAVSYKDGELVTPQIAIVTITNLKSLFLEVSLEQQLILRVKKNQSAFISFESLRNEKTEGVISSVYPRDNQFLVRIDLKTWPNGVIPGMTADVAIVVGNKTNALLIPINTIVAGQVTRIRNGNKERVPVHLGIISDGWAEVISDHILEDDELLTRK